MKHVHRWRITALASAVTVIAVALAGFEAQPVVSRPTQLIADADAGAGAEVAEHEHGDDVDAHEHVESTHTDAYEHLHDGPHATASGDVSTHDHAVSKKSTYGHHEARATKAELAKPGDRGYPGTPSWEQQLAGSLSSRDGLFASVCPISHTERDDPIVFPRQPGASHPHDFFANKATDAFSTAASLRDAQRTTCKITGDSAAYWTPVLYDDGRHVPPSHLIAYYRVAGRDPRTIEPFPRGLKMIANDQEQSFWGCFNNNGAVRRVDDPPRCGMGEMLEMVIVFPDCWDTKYLDVPDHQSHMKYSVNGKCPPTHPAAVPQLVFVVRYPGADGGHVALGSRDHPLERHADFINAWDQARLARLVTECLNADVDCGADPPR